MADPSSKELYDWLPAGVAAAIVSVLGAFKLLDKFRDTQRDGARTQAELDILEALRAELARTNKQNTELLERVESLQNEVHALRTENAQLAAQLARLTGLDRPTDPT
jgi:uncharacterized protein YlxW (UPF0749 family)